MRGGGVLIATNRQLRCSAIDVVTPLEIVWIRCNASFPPVLIGVCYRPPNSDSSFMPLFHDNLLAIKSAHQNVPILLFGDFNFPSIDWSDLAPTLSSNSFASQFVDTCLTFGLSQIVTNPTRITDHSANILDLILSTHPEHFSSLCYLQGLSDHAVLHTTYQCKLQETKKKKKTITLYNHGDYTNMNQELETFADNFATNFSSRSVDSNWNTFKNEMHRLIHLYIPTTTITERLRSPWFNVALKRLNNKKSAFSVPLKLPD